MPPKRLYVVLGKPDPEGANVPYPTDPRSYGLDALDRPVSDDEFDREYRHRVHAYQDVDHAVDAMYRCGLEPVGSFLNVFLRIDVNGVYDEEATKKVIEETAWRTPLRRSRPQLAGSLPR